MEMKGLLDALKTTQFAIDQTSLNPAERNIARGTWSWNRVKQWHHESTYAETLEYLNDLRTDPTITRF